MLVFCHTSPSVIILQSRLTTLFYLNGSPNGERLGVSATSICLRACGPCLLAREDRMLQGRGDPGHGAPTTSRSPRPFDSDKGGWII
jgi:hypothetical protein